MTQPCTPPAMAVAKSASSRITLADLPPSSCATRFTVGAAAIPTCPPARREPVIGAGGVGGGGGARAPPPGGAGGAGERPHVDLRMRRDRGADVRAVAV